MKPDVVRLAPFGNLSGVSRVAHFQVNTEFGELCTKGASKIFPSQKLIEYDAGTDLRSLVLRAKKANPEAVYQTGYEGDYISRLKAETDLNLKLPTGMPEPLLTEVVVSSVGSALGRLSYLWF